MLSWLTKQLISFVMARTRAGDNALDAYLEENEPAMIEA
jgi:hypothetical protein